MKLNTEQKAILEHTAKNRIFCGGSKDMDFLVDSKLMKCLGKKSFVPDEYYCLTAEGRRTI